MIQIIINVISLHKWMYCSVNLKYVGETVSKNSPFLGYLHFGSKNGPQNIVGPISNVFSIYKLGLKGFVGKSNKTTPIFDDF